MPTAAKSTDTPLTKTAAGKSPAPDNSRRVLVAMIEQGDAGEAKIRLIYPGGQSRTVDLSPVDYERARNLLIKGGLDPLPASAESRIKIKIPE